MKHPSEKLAVHRTRGPLPNFRRALASGTVRVGFLGGSITDQKAGTRWPEGFAAWVIAKWPKVRWIFENAAIGTTGSDLAVFRAKREIFERDCDLVFVMSSQRQWHAVRAPRADERRSVAAVASLRSE